MGHIPHMRASSLQKKQKQKTKKKTKLRHAKDVRPIRTVARVDVYMVQHASEKGEES